MSLLTIIVTYNAMQWLERCLNSLCESSIVPDIFIVDNGSTDGTQDYIKGHYPHILFQQSSENLGFGRANNIGLQYALDHHYDYVYLLNQDAWVLPNTIETLIKVSKKYLKCGVLSPMQMEANMMHLDCNFKENTCSFLSCPELIDALYFEKDQDVLSVNNTVMAAHWLITRECLEKVGGFSPSFKHYGEDNNFIQRVHYHGLKVGIVPLAKAVHDRENRELSFERKMYMSYVAMMIMLSSPISLRYYRFAILCYMTCLDMIKLKSYKPLGNFIKILRKYPMLRKNMQISRNSTCAFLSMMNI